MITLLYRYPYCAGAAGAGGTVTFPWVPYPEIYGDCEVHLICHNHNSGQCDMQLEGSVAGETSETIGAALSIGAIGASVGARDVTGAMVRPTLSSNADAAIMTISVILVPKQS